ncbi:MAG: PAS domain S-box protein [Thermodesulfobacteriota bacterium]
MISLIDSVELAASLLALCCVLILHRHAPGPRAIKVLILCILVQNTVHGAGNVLEWSGISDLLDPVSDNLKTLSPALWGSLFYLLLRRKAEKDLKLSRQRFQDLVESTPDIVWEADRQLRYTYVSPRIEALLGRPPATLLGESPLAFMAEDERQRVEPLLADLIEGTGSVSSLELAVVNLDGHQRIIETSAVPYYDDNGGHLGFRGILRDITSRKNNEQELARYRLHLEREIAARTENLQRQTESLEAEIQLRRQTEQALLVNENRYRTLFTSSQDAILILKDDRISACNPKAEQLFGRDGHSLLGQSIPCLSPASQPDGRKSLTLWQGHANLALAGDAQIFNWSAARTDGSVIDSEISLQRFSMDGVFHLQAIVRDISLRKRLVAEMLKTQKLESTAILAGGIAHDFNNLLTGIVGNISLAKMSLDPDQPAFRHLEKTEQVSMRAKNLTRQLLTFAKGGKPVTRPASIAGLVEDTARFLLAGSAVSFRMEAGENLWTVCVDEGQISQVIQNLTTNALQAMGGAGTLTIRIGNVDAGPASLPVLPPGRYVHIEVQDSGNGIPPEIIDKVFDPFFSGKGQGSGLGLSVAFSVIRNHGGAISVESPPGMGTIFHIHLPAVDEEPETAAPENAPDRAPGRGRIMVMDDEETVREVAANMLEFLGYTPFSVADGAEAVRLYQQEMHGPSPFSAVIMDLTIPGGMGGLEALRHLRAIDAGIVSIVSSGYANDPILAEFREHGFSGMLSKPYLLQDLARVLSTLLPA